jgi:hypothetical protein
MTDGFWAAVEAQLAELRTATSADDVLRILAPEHNPYGADSASGEGFFAGSGGDDSMQEALEAAGWHLTWAEASYYYVIQAPNGDLITYVEGDVYRGDQAIKR